MSPIGRRPSSRRRAPSTRSAQTGVCRTTGAGISARRRSRFSGAGSTATRLTFHSSVRAAGCFMRRASLVRRRHHNRSPPTSSTCGMMTSRGTGSFRGHAARRA
eukprot:286634-Prymnesium_polylepis.1